MRGGTPPRPREPSAQDADPADVVAVLDAATPSNVDTVGSLLAAAAEAHLRLPRGLQHARGARGPAARPTRHRHLAPRRTGRCSPRRPAGARGRPASQSGQAASCRAALSRAAADLPPACAGCSCSARRCRPSRPAARLQEALGRLQPRESSLPPRSTSWSPLPPSRSRSRDVLPFVTMQHGAVNILYAPFRADQYWVWSDDDAEALRALQPERAASVRVVRRETDREPAPLPSRAGVRRQLDLPAGGSIVLMYSQTHGAEFSGATHFSIAAQLAEALPKADPICTFSSSATRASNAAPTSRYSVASARIASSSRRKEQAPATCARAADVACAISSTALRDAAAAGMPGHRGALAPNRWSGNPVAASRVGASGTRRRPFTRHCREKSHYGMKASGASLGPSLQTKARQHSQEHCRVLRAGGANA